MLESGPLLPLPKLKLWGWKLIVLLIFFPRHTAFRTYWIVNHSFWWWFLWVFNFLCSIISIRWSAILFPWESISCLLAIHFSFKTFHGFVQVIQVGLAVLLTDGGEIVASFFFAAKSIQNSLVSILVTIFFGLGCFFLSKHQTNAFADYPSLFYCHPFIVSNLFI